MKESRLVEQLSKNVDEYTLSGYNEWTILKEVDANKSVLIISLSIFFAISFSYAMQLSTSGLLIEDPRETNSNSSNSLLVVLFMAGYVSIFIAFIVTQLLSPYIN